MSFIFLRENILSPEEVLHLGLLGDGSSKLFLKINFDIFKLVHAGRLGLGL